MQNAVRWGVLGCADIGLRAVVPAIQAADGCVVTAVASRDLEKAQAAAERLGIPKACGSYEALLEDGDVDAVYVPLPNSLHVPWSLRAVAAGKHVLCEKPLGTSPDDVEALRRAADAAGRLVAEALMYQFHPQTLKVKELIASGALGTVRHVSASFTYNIGSETDIRMYPELGGGVLWDVGMYCVHVARSMFAAEPVAVAGMAIYGASGVDETFAGVLRFPNGTATFDCSLRAPRTQQYTVTGSEASLRCLVPFAPGPQERTLVIHSGKTRDTVSQESLSVPGADQYRLMVEAFVTRLRAPGPITNDHLEDVRANVAVLAALHRSARSQAFVDL